MLRLLTLLMGIFLLAASCIKENPAEQVEEYEITDTLTRISLSIFPNWDFKSTRPIILNLGFQEYRYDSVFAWDPLWQEFVEWQGTAVNGWHYDYDDYGKYRITFHTDNIVDTSQPAFDDRGSYLKYWLNAKLSNKPVVEIFDTVANKMVATLLLGNNSYIAVDLDTGRYIHSIPSRPSSVELAKKLNKCLQELPNYYRFRKPQY